MKVLPYAAFLILTATLPLAAAETFTPAAEQSGKAVQTSAENPAVTPPAKTNGQQVKAALPAEYRSIRLGMGIDAVKEALKQDAVFGYRGERDVSLLPTENRSLIESAGSYFISRSWFQFYKDNLSLLQILRKIRRACLYQPAAGCLGGRTYQGSYRATTHCEIYRFNGIQRIDFSKYDREGCV